jgi:hypothetical protein
MNLIELYIVEVHSVRTVEESWGSYVEIDATTNGYGNVSRGTHTCRTMAEWEAVKARGYFLG